MAEITISYTPAITSSASGSSPFICHRICYRYGAGGAGAYCCLEDSTDSVAGTPKTFVITVHAAPCASVPDVDPDDCSATPYTGYVQACCEDESSLSGRVYWSALFVSDPTCVSKIICCISQRSLSDGTITISNAGNGYTPGTVTVTVVRDPSDPVTASLANDAILDATASVGGVITSINITSGGLYGVIPILIINSPPAASPPGVTATAVISIPCADATYWGNCDDATTDLVPIQVGQCIDTCLPKTYPFIYDNNVLSGPENTTDFTYVQSGCCDCDTCKNYTVVTGSSLEFINLCWVTCDKSAPSHQLCLDGVVPGSGSFELLCIVPGSLYSTNDPGGIISLIETGDCASCT